VSETAIGVFGLLLLIGLFLTGLEMAFAMAIVGVVGYAVVMGPTAAMNMLANDFVDSLQAYGITVFPLFMLMGQIVFNGGMARRLYDGAYKFLGHVPGGLAVATVVGAGIFKAMCGSATATSATFASVAVPEMDRYGYSKKLSTGIVATVGTLGMLIPPAGTLILLGIITEQSIGKLFVAGIVPGIILALLFVINLLTSPGHWWIQWPALGLGIAWVISLFRVMRAVVLALARLLAGHRPKGSARAHEFSLRSEQSRRTWSRTSASLDMPVTAESTAESSGTR